MAELLVIHVPGDIEPLDRGERFEDPLDRALRKAGKLGRCVGGGTAFETEPEFRITGCDIEVDVADVARALPVIRDSLKAAAAPTGTTVTHVDSERILLKATRAGFREFSPSNRPAKKRFVDSCPWPTGEVLAYRLSRDRYVLLHVYGFGGAGPLFWVPDWCGASIPSANDIRKLVRAAPERYRLGVVYQAWRQEETDPDDRRVIPTGVVVPPPKNGLRGWFPGMVEWRPWREFERMLKEVFGLVKVSPAARLNHDLGLELSVAHFALWDATDRVTTVDASRLFAGHTSGFRRTHPDRVRQPVTEELRSCVDELKARFLAEDVWRGEFAAKEGFVVILVNRKKRDHVWEVLAKLARRHGLTCFDPASVAIVTGRRARVSP